MTALLRGGYVDIYDGVRPGSPDVEYGGRPLVSLRFGELPVARGGMIEARVTRGRADRAGIATWYRCYAADHRTAICDGSVGVADADLIVSATFFNEGATVDIASVEVG